MGAPKLRTADGREHEMREPVTLGMWRAVIDYADEEERKEAPTLDDLVTGRARVLATLYGVEDTDILDLSTLHRDYNEAGGWILNVAAGKQREIPNAGAGKGKA